MTTPFDPTHFITYVADCCSETHRIKLLFNESDNLLYEELEDGSGDVVAFFRLREGVLEMRDDTHTDDWQTLKSYTIVALSGEEYERKMGEVATAAIQAARAKLEDYPLASMVYVSGRIFATASVMTEMTFTKTMRLLTLELERALVVDAKQQDDAAHERVRKLFTVLPEPPGGGAN